MTRSISNVQAPKPRDLESKVDFTARFLEYQAVKSPALSVYRRNQIAENVWGQAKLKSRVSLKNEQGEWLLID